jgi:beta-galactosidase/beta-glucuronidase
MGGKAVHDVSKIIGFRTIEQAARRQSYVNGSKVRLKGSNRHSIWPTSGRTTSKALSYQDAKLMKEMNMNAVRMSHYPPDPHFLDVADEVGLYVIDELTGWQKLMIPMSPRRW